jgi:hypothetical protein
MHRCDRPDKLPSISIDQRISRRRQNQAFYTDSIALVRLGRNHHERDCKQAQGRKITKSAVLELSGLSWKAYPKRGPRGCRIIVTAVVSTRQSRSKRHSAGEVELERCTTVVEAR